MNWREFCATVAPMEAEISRLRRAGRLEEAARLDEARREIINTEAKLVPAKA